ncbi:142_t:CDS:10, partial [Acaulospora colombiana]
GPTSIVSRLACCLSFERSLATIIHENRHFKTPREMPTVILEQLFNKVDMGENHSPAAISFQSQLVCSRRACLVSPLVTNSERNPVPTIQKYEEDKEKQEQQLENEIKEEAPDSHEVEEEDEDKNLTQGQKEKKEMMAKMNANQQKPIEQVKKRRGQRVVDDPVTGEKVIIKDAEFKGMKISSSFSKGPSLLKLFPDFPSQQQLDPKSGVPGPALTGLNGAAKKLFHQSRTAPNPAYPSNISLQPFPPSTPPSLDTIMSYLYYLEYGIIGAGFLLWFFLAFGHGFWVFLFRSIFISALCFAGSTVASLAQRKLEREVERVRYDMHRQRGEKFAPPTPESVEWLNAFTKLLIRIVADSIEDVMQQSLPKFVEAIRISDIGQGTNPFRIISMRALPDQPGEKEYPREEWIDQGTNELMDASEKSKGQDMDQAGDYVNYEVAFAYQALPGQGDKLRAKNIHLLLEFFLGFADWVHIPIPIWVQVDGVAGTVRLRIQFIPEPPFVRNLTFTLMGVPAVDVSVTPLIKRLPNLLDLPLISKFVKMAIAAGTASIVAPKSMTLNIQELMSGAAIGDTRSLGVFIIRIQYCEDLSAQDRNGKSDPYIVLAYAKVRYGLVHIEEWKLTLLLQFGKPLYSTRIILGDLNPVFEETAFLLVTHEEVKADENLSAMLWDSVRFIYHVTVDDDLIGRVEIPVKELMAKPNKMFDRADKLVGFENATAMLGILHIGYFDKVPLNRALERPPENPQPAKKPAAAMEMHPRDKGPRPAATDPPPPAPDVQRTPPDP